MGCRVYSKRRGGQLLIAEYIIQEETLVGIADAIRSKTGESDRIAVADMADKISGIAADEKVETTVALNFSEGDMQLTPEDGKVFSSVNIPAPATLIPENIAKDVNIAGIIGTLVAGGGAKVATGSVTGSASSGKRISHNLGVVPDIFIVYDPALNAASNSIIIALGISKAYKTITGNLYSIFGYYYNNGTKTSASKNTIDATSSAVMYGATSSSITVGMSSVYLGRLTYNWIAIGGLT